MLEGEQPRAARSAAVAIREGADLGDDVELTRDELQALATALAGDVGDEPLERLREAVLRELEGAR